MPELIPRLAGYWSLFEDWCEAFDKPCLPTTADTIVEFLRTFPSGVPTNTLRVRAVRQQHQNTGTYLDLDALRSAAGRQPFGGMTPPPTLVRTGPGMTQSVAEALTQLPKVKHGKSPAPAMRGRRDAVIVVLFGVLGLTRQDIRKVAVANIRVSASGVVKVQGVDIPPGDNAESCPACAVTRWLRIVTSAELGYKKTVTDRLTAEGYDAAHHDCDDALDDEWTHATTLLPAIDQHGWVHAHASVTVRSISGIAGRVQKFTGYREHALENHEAKATRFDGMSTKRFTEEMDDFDARVARALALSNDILAEANDASDSMWRLLDPKAG